MQAKPAYFCVIVPPPALSPTQDLTKAAPFVFFLIQNNGADSALSVLRRRHCRRVSIAHSLSHRIWEITLSKFCEALGHVESIACARAVSDFAEESSTVWSFLRS
jgi:hypothetical protein